MCIFIRVCLHLHFLLFLHYRLVLCYMPFPITYFTTVYFYPCSYILFYLFHLFFPYPSVTCDVTCLCIYSPRLYCYSDSPIVEAERGKRQKRKEEETWAGVGLWGGWRGFGAGWENSFWVGAFCPSLISHRPIPTCIIITFLPCSRPYILHLLVAGSSAITYCLPCNLLVLFMIYLPSTYLWFHDLLCVLH